MKKYLLGMFLLLFFACGSSNNDQPLKFFKREFSHYQSIISNKDAPVDPDINLERKIVNQDYPIEISLYQDRKFFYNLPNLGDGFGTWKYVNGHIELFAERTLFNMNITILSTEENGDALAISFVDRHGQKVLPVKTEN